MLRQYGGGTRREGFAVTPAVILDDPEIGQMFHYRQKTLGSIHGAMHQHHLGHGGIARSLLCDGDAHVGCSAAQSVDHDARVSPKID